MSDVGGAAALVVDDCDLVALGAEPQHRSDEVVGRPPEQPRRAHDPPLAYLALAGQLRPAVDGERIRLVRLDVRCPLRAVEDVVGREVDDGRAAGDDVPRPQHVHVLGRVLLGLRSVDVRPRSRVQHEVVRLGHLPDDVQLEPRQRVRLREHLGQRRPELAAAPVIRTRACLSRTGSAMRCSRGASPAGRPTRSRARRDRPGRTPRSRGSRRARSVSASKPCAWRPGM